MRRITSAISIAALLFTTLLAFGQTGLRRGQGRPDMSPQARLQRMSEQLNLTDDQKSKVSPILENENKQMQSLHSDTSLSQQDRWSKMQEIHKNTLSQIRPLLNADQQKKLDQMQQRQAERGRGRRGVQGQGSGDTSNQQQ